MATPIKYPVGTRVEVTVSNIYQKHMRGGDQGTVKDVPGVTKLYTITLDRTGQDVTVLEDHIKAAT